MRGNCTSGMSYPAAKLEWKINGFPVYLGESINYGILNKTTGEGKKQKVLQASTVGLQFLISHQHFNEVGKIKVSQIFNK